MRRVWDRYRHYFAKKSDCPQRYALESASSKHSTPNSGRGRGQQDIATIRHNDTISVSLVSCQWDTKTEEDIDFWHIALRPSAALRGPPSSELALGAHVLHRSNGDDHHFSFSPGSTVVADANVFHRYVEFWRWNMEEQARVGFQGSRLVGSERPEDLKVGSTCAVGSTCFVIFPPTEPETKVDGSPGGANNSQGGAPEVTPLRRTGPDPGPVGQLLWVDPNDLR